MATTSGTTGATVYRVSDLVETIGRRCGVQAANLTPESIDVITGAMWRLLAHLSNRGINLWRIYHALYAMVNGQQQYTLARGDIDIMRAVHRQPVRLSPSAVTSSAGGTTANLSDGDITTVCTQVSTNGNFVFDWGSGNLQQVGLIGLLSSVVRTYNLVFEISNDLVTWTQVLAPGSVSYSGALPWMWYEIDPTGQPARYFRVRETGGATMSFDEIVLAAQWNDVDITRWNLDQWSTNPSKRSQGTPRQYYFDRQITPVANLWPVPNSTENFNLMCLWIHRHIEDVGVMTNILDIPERWYQPVVDLLSWMVLPELPNADLKRYDMLKEQAMAVTLPDAEKEERDKAPINLVPQIGVYTK